MNRKNILIVMACVFALFLSLMPVLSNAAQELQQPQQLIQDISETLKKKLQDKAFASNFPQVTQFVNGLIEPHTDFEKIAPLVLGRYWGSASPDERERFKHEFQTLLVRAYSRAFVEYHDWAIQYLPLDMSSNPAKVMVKTNVLQRSTEPIEVNYRMYLDKGEWKVYDIVIDGVSLVTNYRSSFSEDIKRRGSLVAVIDNLAKRNTQALEGKP